MDEKLKSWLQPKLEELGAFLVEIRHIASQRKIEVFAEKRDPSQRMDLDSCVQISRHLEFHLDHEDGMPGDYTLEVSSPGMSNPFKVMDQYLKHCGAVVEVLQTDGIKHMGMLEETNEERVVLRTFGDKKPNKKKHKHGPKKITPELPPENGPRVEIPFESIKSTVRIFQF